MCASIGSTFSQVNDSWRYHQQSSPAQDVFLPDMPGVSQAEILHYLQELLRINPGLLPDRFTTSFRQQHHTKDTHSDSSRRVDDSIANHAVNRSASQEASLVPADQTTIRQGPGSISLRFGDSCVMVNQGNDQGYYRSAQSPPPNSYRQGDHWRNEERGRDYYVDTNLVDNSSAILGRVEGFDSGYGKTFLKTTLSGNSFAILGDAPASVAQGMGQRTSVTQHVRATLPLDQVTRLLRSATMPASVNQQNEVSVNEPHSRFVRMDSNGGFAPVPLSSNQAPRRSMTGDEFLGLFRSDERPPQYTAAEAQRYPAAQPQPVERQSPQAKASYPPEKLR